MSSTKPKVLVTSLIVLGLALFANYYLFEDSTDTQSKNYNIPIMSGSIARLSVFVLGATGEVGKEVVKELACHTQIEQVTLIGRRKMDLPQSDDTCNYEKFTQTIVDFDKLASDHAAAFEGFDVGISTLGTTRGKAGKDGFYKVDHDYVVESAKLAKLGGCKHLNLVTSANSNKNSFIYYSQVKGEVENEITQMGFERLSIYRPGVLLCDRTESRAIEKVSRAIIGTMDRWRKLSVETSVVAKAIVNRCIHQSTSKSPVEILDNGSIIVAGKDEVINLDITKV